MKHAFDVCYYPCLDTTRGRPFGLYLHGNEGTEGAENGVTAITTGLGWAKAAEYVVVSGKPSKGDLESCWELGATGAAQLMERVGDRMLNWLVLVMATILLMVLHTWRYRQ